MIPLVCIVGNSGAGKTTLAERLVAELKGRGYRLTVAKHTGDRVEFDKKGTDSWRLAEAGGDQVLLFSPNRIMMNHRQDKDLSLDEALLYVDEDSDLFIAEGYRKETAPKIAVHRKALGQAFDSSRQGLLAVVTDEPLDIKVPQFAWEDIKGVADMVEKKLLLHREDRRVSLFVNGQPIKMNGFVQEIVAGTMEGLVSGLKVAGPVNSLDLRIRHIAKEKDGQEEDEQAINSNIDMRCKPK